MELRRIKLRVIREKKVQWVHFCYVPKALKTQFESIVNPDNLGGIYNKWVNDWANEDFGMTVETWDDLEELRAILKNMYKEMYPELYRDNVTDIQGWNRVWVNKHIKKEIEKHGFNVIEYI